MRAGLGLGLVRLAWVVLGSRVEFDGLDGVDGGLDVLDVLADLGLPGDLLAPDPVDLLQVLNILLLAVTSFPDLVPMLL